MEYPPVPDWNDDLSGHKHPRNPTFVVSLVLVGGDVDNDTFLCLTRERSMSNGMELTNISLVRKGSFSGKGFLLRIFSFTNKVESHRKFSEIAPRLRMRGNRHWFSIGSSSSASH